MDNGPEPGEKLWIFDQKTEGDVEKKYLDIDVYEAFQRRMDFIFQEFDNIYVSFSGGKDSALLLHCLLYTSRCV